MLSMKSRFKQLWNAQRWALLGALAGLLLFVALYGVQVLDPTNTAWLLGGNGDPAQHQLGWEFFRQSPWRLPYPGLNYQILYPHRISMIYTDSLPLFALVCKLFSPLLPPSFQYFGWWGLLCYLLQGWFGQKLVAAIGGAKCGQTGKQLAALAGAVLLLLFPALQVRMFGHAALAGNWLILAALYLWVRSDALAGSLRSACLWWGLMGVLAAGFHMYYLPMLGIVSVGCAVRSALCRRGAAMTVLPVVSYCAGALLLLVPLGAFAGNFSGASGGMLVGTDLLALFTDRFSGELERNVFVGAGSLAACAAALALLLLTAKKKPLGGTKSWWISGAVILALSVAASLSNTVSVAGHEWFTLPLPSPVLGLWSTFSSCARIAWVAGYLLVAAACGLTLRLGGARLGAAALALCAGLQAASRAEPLMALHEGFYTTAGAALPQEAEGWQTLADSGLVQHLAFVSPIDLDSDGFWRAARAAARHNWTLNDFYVAHADGALLNKTVLGTLDTVEPGYLYLFGYADEPRRDTCPLHYYRLDGWLVGSVEELPLGQEDQGGTGCRVPLEAFLPAGEEPGVRLEDGTLHIEVGSAAANRQITLFPGKYVVTLEGTNLDQSYTYALAGEDDWTIKPQEITYLESSSGRLSFQFYLYDIVPCWQTAIHTLEQPIELTGMTLEKVP